MLSLINTTISRYRKLSWCLYLAVQWREWIVITAALIQQRVVIALVASFGSEWESTVDPNFVPSDQ